MDINRTVADLIRFARQKLLLSERDETFAVNKLIDILGPIDYEKCPSERTFDRPDALLDEVIAYAVEKKIIETEYDKETLTDMVMGALSAMPSVVENTFNAIAAERGGKAATDFLYGYCVSNSYVKRSKLDKNPRFDTCGLTVTINKSRPEFKDAKAAAAQSASKYPSCVICRVNEGYGLKNKRTLRTVSLKLGGEDFFWQYSPYGYFNEHGIAVNRSHKPMYVDKTTFEKLIDFVDIFPHYFIGCNAALPRIGGSILAHDHYQGGGEVLPLQKAKIKRYFKDPKHKNAVIGAVDWQGTVLRVIGSRADVVAVSEAIRAAWTDYSAPSLGIIARDADGVHNAVSPTVIKTKSGYEMNIILRNNIVSKEYPDGVFHAHPEFHCIKKESIGLIEAQGLFILPGRLEGELNTIAECLDGGKPLPKELAEFGGIFAELAKLYKGDSAAAIREELGSVCNRILQNTAVFKADADLNDFMVKSGFEL